MKVQIPNSEHCIGAYKRHAAPTTETETVDLIEGEQAWILYENKGSNRKVWANMITLKYGIPTIELSMSIPIWIKGLVQSIGRDAFGYSVTDVNYANEVQ